MGDIMGEFIDFADIPNMICRFEMERIYEFNLMLVGLRKSGKSALVSSLFQGQMRPKQTEEPSQGNHRELNVYEDLLEENGVKLRLRCIETSNYKTHVINDYVKYIDEQLSSHFRARVSESAWKVKDNLVHCCLYLIPSSGPLKLDEEDLDCMKALHEKVNLVPVIANADHLSSVKIAKFKENIISDLELNGIKYFKFHYDVKEDEDRHRMVKIEAERFPFAIMAADEPTMIDNKKKWLLNTICGKYDIYDEKICDTDALAKLMIRHCMLELMDSTYVKHYSKFKSEVIERARIHGGKELQAMGLKAHEIKRILDLINHKSKSMSVRKKRAEMEEEVKVLRLKVEKMRVEVAASR